MTTYKDPFYRGETAHVLSQYCSLSDLVKENNKGIFDYYIEDSGDTGGFAVAGHAYGLAKDGKLKFFLEENFSKFNPSFSELIGSLENVKVGFLACMDIVGKIWRGEWNFFEDLNWAAMRASVAHLFTVGVQASYGGPLLPPKALKNRGDNAYTDAIQNIERLENAALQIAHIKSIGQDRSYVKQLKVAKVANMEYPQIRKGVVFADKTIDLYRLKNVSVIIDRKRKQSYALINKDLTRISQTVRSFALILEYFDFKGVSFSKLEDSHYRRAKMYLEHIVNTFRKADCITVNKVAQAYDSVYFLWLARIANDLTNINEKHMLDKIADKGLDKIVSPEEVLNFVRDLPIADAGDLLKIYKCIHVPDYCPNSALRKFKDMHYNVNPIAEEGLYLEFLEYRKLAFIRHYNRKIGRNPGKVSSTFRLRQEAYEQAKVGSIKMADVKDIDLRGCLEFRRYESEVIKFVKDKKTAPVEERKIITKTGRTEINEYDENYGLGFLRDENMASEQFVKDHFAQGTVYWKHYMKAALKPESKKPDARLFQIGNRYDRLMLSMAEDNVGDFIEGKPGVFIGVDSLRKKRILRDSTSLLRTMDHGSTDQLIISFDLKSFSPNFNPRAKKDLYDFWAEKFNEPAISAAFDVFGSGISYMDKFNLHWMYNLQGNDIEGFSARMNTDWHVDLMAFSIKKLKELKLVKREAFLACLIDDGLLKLTFDEELTLEKSQEIMSVIERVYAAASMKISYDKTLISKKVGVFLNEVVYSGTIVDLGCKAYMKIGPDKKNPLASFTDEIGEIFANAQGAVNSGANWFGCYYRYIKEVVKSRCTWDRFDNSSPELDSVKFFAPVGFGGYGVNPLITLASNESFSQHTTGLSVLRNIAIRYPNRRKFIVQILNTEKSEISSRAFLRSPGTIRIEGPILSSKRYLSETEKYVMDITRNPVVKDAVDHMNEKSLDVLATAFRATASVNAMVVFNAYAATPEYLLDNIVMKFASSSTIADLLPVRTRVRISIQNAQDFRSNARWWRKFA